MLNSCKNSVKILKIVSVHAAIVAKDVEEKNALFDMLIFIRDIRTDRFIKLNMAHPKRKNLAYPSY